MSRGAGRIERAIAAIFAAEPENAFTTEELCERVYSDVAIEKRHRVAVVRAFKTLAARGGTLSTMQAQQLGGSLVFYDRCNVMSYAMARLKADFLHNYRSRDRRVGPWLKRSESDLRALLAPGGSEHRCIVEDGPWWLFVQQWIAERDGDQKRTASIGTKIKRMQAKALADLKGLGRPARL